jgi:hypothetical protein
MDGAGYYVAHWGFDHLREQIRVEDKDARLSSNGRK